MTDKEKLAAIRRIVWPKGSFEFTTQINEIRQIVGPLENEKISEPPAKPENNSGNQISFPFYFTDNEGRSLVMDYQGARPRPVQVHTSQELKGNKCAECDHDFEDDPGDVHFVGSDARNPVLLPNPWEKDESE